MKASKRAVSLFGAAVLSVSVLAAGAVSAESTAENGAEDLYLGMVVPTLADEFQINLTDRVSAWAEENGIKLEIASYEMDLTEMVTQIENLATLGVTDLYIGPMDVGSTQDAVKGLHDQNVRVTLAPGTGIDPQYYDLNMDINQYDCGVNVAQMAADWIDATFPDAEDGSIEVIAFGNSANESVKRRGDGTLEIEKLTPKAKVVETYDLVGEANADAKTQEYLDSALLSHPDAKVILCATGSNSIAANEVVMRTAGLNYEEIGLFSGDSMDAQLELIKQSETNDAVLRGCCGFQDVADAWIKFVSGEIDPSQITEDTKTYYLELLPITLENLSEYYEG